MPAPSRLIVQRPGFPSAQISETVSEWIQPENIEVPMEDALFLSPTPIEAMQSIEEDVSGYVADPPLPDDMYPVDFQTFASTFTYEFAGLPTYGNTELVLVHRTWEIAGGTYLDDDDPFHYKHTLMGKRGAFTRTVCARPVDTAWDDTMRAEWPPGAIGYEVEQYEVTEGNWMALSDPESLVIQVENTGLVEGGIHPGGLVIRTVAHRKWWTVSQEDNPLGDVPMPGQVQFDDFVRVASPLSETYASSQYGNVYYPMPWEGVGPTETEQIEINTFHPTCPPYSGLVTLHWAIVNVGNALVLLNEGSDRMSFEASATITGTYTARPPRYRWIYPATITAKGLQARVRFS